MKTLTIQSIEKPETNSAFTWIPITPANIISTNKLQINQHMKTSDSPNGRLSFFGLVPLTAKSKTVKDNYNITKISIRKSLIPKSVVFAIAMLIANIFFVTNIFGQTTVTYNNNGTFIAPAGVNNVTVQAWGGGGAGGGVTRTTGTVNAGGGAGGAYASSIVAVSPGNTYTVTVAGQKTATVTSSAATNTGNPSWFGSTSTVYAQGGPGGNPANNNTTNGGTGSSTLSIGTTVVAGANGANGNTNTTGSSGGAGANSGGAGAAGVTGNSNGGTGTAPGGGGSGGRASSGGNQTFNGGTGAAGRVTVTYTCPVYTLSSPSTSTRCNGILATYTATSSTTGLAYSWTRSAVAGITPATANGSTADATEALVNSTTNPINVTYVYTLSSVTSSATCSNTQSVTVTVNPSVTITGTPFETCLNTSKTLIGSGTPAVSNAWVSSNPSVAIVDNTGKVTGLLAGTTDITYRDIDGCSTTVLFTVGALPVAGVATATPSDICNGSSTTLILSGSSGSIQWQESADGLTNWTDVTGGSGATTASYTSANLTTTTYYRAELNGICSPVYTDPVMVTVKPALSLFNVTGATTICANSSANIALSGSVSGVNYELRNNSNNNLIGSALPGDGNPLIFSTGPVPTTTTYKVVAVDPATSCTEQMTGTATITTQIAPVASFSASSLNVTTGATVNFSDLSSNTPTSWSWVFAGGTPSTSTLQNPSVVYNVAGNYDVTLTSSNTCTGLPVTVSGYIHVTALSIPTTFNSNNSFIVPPGVTVVQVEAWGGGGKGGQRGTPDGGAGGGGGGAYAKGFLSVSPGQAYDVIIGAGSTTTAAGGDTRYRLLPTGADLIRATGGGSVANNATAGALGGSAATSVGVIKFNGGQGGDASTNSGAQNGGGGGSSGGTASAGNYISTVINSAGGVVLGGGTGGAGSTVDDVAGGAGNAPGGGGGGARRNNNTISGGNGASGRIIVTWVDASNFSIAATTPICSGNTSTITVHSTSLANGNYTVTYSTSSPSTSGNTATMAFSAGTGTFSTIALSGTTSDITITGITFTGWPINAIISSNNVATVTVTPLPATPTISTIDPTSICATAGEHVLMSSNAATGNQWYKNGSPIAGAITQDYTANELGTYTVIVTENGCPSPVSNSIDVTLKVPTIIMAPSAASVCFSTTAQNTTLTYSNPVNNPTSYSITWDDIPTNTFQPINDQPFAFTNPITVIVPANADPGTYTGHITVKSGGVCESVPSSFTVTVKPLPSAAFSYAGSPFCATVEDVIPTVTVPGGSFTANSPDLKLNAVTGVINIASSLHGDYVITYTTPPINGCTNSSNFPIHIKSRPTVTISYGSSFFCYNYNDSIPVVRTTTQQIFGENYKAFPKNGLTIKSKTGKIFPGTSTPGTYTITNTYNHFTDGGFCNDSVKTVVTIEDVLDLQVLTQAPSVCFGNSTNISIGTPEFPSLSGTTYELQTVFAGNTITVSAVTPGNNGVLLIPTPGLDPGTYTFSVHAVNTATGCTRDLTQTATVTVTDPPNANIVQSTIKTICVNGSITVEQDAASYTVGTGFNWTTSGNGTLSGTNTLTPTYTAVASDGGHDVKLTLHVTNFPCLEAKADYFIHVTALPIVSIPTPSICLGGTTTLIPSTGGTWVSNNLNSATVDASTGVVMGIAAGSATFTFTNTATGCSNTTSALTVDPNCQVVTLNQPAQLSATILDDTKTICAGKSLSITISDITGGTLPYKVTYDGITHNIINLPFTFDVTPSTSGPLNGSNVSVSDAHNCFSNTSGTVSVTILNAFTPGAIATTGQTICYGGDPAAIGSQTLASGGDENITYKWESSTDGFGSDINEIPGATSATYDPGTLVKTTSFRRSAHDGLCNGSFELSAGVWTVTVHDIFSAGAIANTGETICYNGNPGVIGSTTDPTGGDGSFTYKWESSTDGFATAGVEIAGAILSTYDPGVLTETTSFRRYAHDGTCNTTFELSSGVWTVTVRKNFNSGAILTAGQTICFNTAASVIGSQTDATGGDGSISYKWESSVDGFATAGTEIINATSSTYIPGILTQTTSFRRYAYDGTCNTTALLSDGTWVVTVHGDFTAGAIATTGETICYNSDASVIGNTTDASGGEGFVTYRWQSSTDEFFTQPVTLDNSNSATFDPTGNLTVTTWYRRQAKDGNCSPDFINSAGVWKVTVLGNLSAGSIASNGAQICYGGDPSEIASVGPATDGASLIVYSWQSSADENFTSPVNISSNTLTYDPPANLTATTWYRRIATATENNVSCSVASNSFKVTVNPLPVAIAGSNSPICKYYNLDLTADGGVSYAWSGPNGWTSTEQNPTRTFFTQELAGTYTVTVTNSFGCTSTATTTAELGSEIYYQASSNSPLCEGATLSLHVTDGAKSYSWTGPNNFTSTEQNPFRSDITTADAGMYTVIASDACGDSYATTIVTVRPRPVVSINGSAAECVGATGIVYTTQPGMTGYLWSIQGGNITSGGTTADNFATVTWTNVGNQSISVNYTNENGCTAVAPVDFPVTVNSLPIPQLSGQSPVCLNSTFVYTTDAGMSSYVWNISAGGTIVEGGTSTSNTVKINWTSEGAQTVSVTYKNGNGCSAASPTVLPVTVNPLPHPTINGTSSSICMGATGNVYTTDSGKSNYIWTLSDGALVTAGGKTTDNTVTITWTTAGSKTVSVNYDNNFGCAAGSPAVYNVEVRPVPVPVINGDPSVCIGTPGHVYTTESGMTGYLWKISAGSGIITAGQGTNSVTVTWTSGKTGFISVNYTNLSGCIALSQTVFPVTINALPTPHINGTPSVCLNAAVDFSTESGMTGYDWKATGGTIAYGSDPSKVTVTWNTPGAGSVSVNYVNGNGCTAVNPTVYNVTVNALPAAVNITGPVSACQGIDGNVYSIPSGYAKYNWTVTGGTKTAGGGIADNTITIKWDNAGQQNVSVSYENSNGCVVAVPASLNVMVNAIPVPTINGTHSGTASVCINTENNIYTTESSMSNYNWRINGGTILAGAGTNSVTVKWTSSTGFENISVNYTNASGCVGSEFGVVNVTVHTLPVVTASSNSPVCEGTALNLTATTTSTGTFSWTGPVTVPDGQNPSLTATIGASGDYTVTMTDVNGCVSLPSTTSVTVNPLPVTTGASMVYGGTSSSLTTTSTCTNGTMNWYKDAQGGSPLGSGNSFDPMDINGSGITATTKPATFTFWVACSNTPNCRASAEFVIQKAEQTISWSDPTEIIYGTSLGISELNATVDGIPSGPIPGVLTYDPAAGAILTVGTHILSVTAAETDYYNAATKTVEIKVISNESTIIVTGSHTFTYNGSPQGPSTSIVTGSTGAVTYTYSGINSTVYNSNTIAPVNAGEYQVIADVAADANFKSATSDPFNFTIEKANSSVTVTGNASYAFTGSPIGPNTSNTTGSTGLVTYVYDGVSALGVTYFPDATRPTKVGSYHVTATLAPDNNHNGASSDSFDFTIEKGPSTVAVTGSTTFIYDGTAQGPSTWTTNGSTGSVTLSYTGMSNSNIAYGPSVSAPTNAGIYQAIATLVADDNYNGATSDPFDFTIGKAASSVVVTGGTTFTYNGTAQGPAGSTTNGSSGTVTFSYSGMANSNIAYGPDATPPTNAGTYHVTATLEADVNYDGATSDPLDFTIGKAISSVVVTGSASFTYDGTPQGPASSTPTGSTGSVTYSYSGMANSNIAYGPDATAPTNAGSYQVIATLAADNNYDGATSDPFEFTIGKAVSSVSVTGNASYPYIGSAQGPATSTTTGSTGSVTYSYTGMSNTNIAYGPLATAPINVGSYHVTATLAADDNYNGANSDPFDFTIVKVSSTIAVTGDATFTYSGTPQGPATSAVTGSAGLVTYSYSGTGSTVYAESATAPINAGTYQVIASVEADNNHESATSSAYPFNIDKATLTITAGTQSVSYGTPETSVLSAGSYTPSGFVHSEGPSVINGLVTYSTNYTALTAAGTSGITITPNVSELTADNYNFISANGIITITSAGANISITGGTFTYNGAPHAATGFAYGNGGESDKLAPDVTFSYVGVNPLDYPASSTAPTNAGTYNVTATFAGNGNYSFASLSTTLTINKAALTIVIKADDKPVYDGNANATINYVGFENSVSYDNLVPGVFVGMFDTKDVGPHKLVTASVGFNGVDPVILNNYTYNTTATTYAAILKPKDITGSFTADNKVYDGDVTAHINSNLTGIFGGDNVTLIGTPTFSDQYVGIGKLVTLNGPSLFGKDYMDYNLISVGTAQADITRRPLTITATDKTKIYGSIFTHNNPAESGDFNVDGLVSTDMVNNVTLSSDGAVATALVGIYPITVDGATGSGLNNYSFIYSNAGTLTVTPKTLTITAKDMVKAYGATLTFTGTEFIAAGLVNGNTVTNVGLSSNGAAASANAGPYNIVPAAPVQGAGLNNYTFDFKIGTLTVGNRILTVTVDDASRLYGTENPAFTSVITGQNAGETFTVTYTTTAVPTSPVGNYAIVPAVQGATLNNYTVVLKNGTLTVNRIGLTITPLTGQSKLYGTNDPVFAYTVSPALNAGETIGGSLARVPGENAGNYAYTIGTLSAGPNYTLTLSSVPTFSITPKEIVVTPVAGQTKVFGNADPTPFNYTVSPALNNGDSFGGALSRLTGEGVGTYVFAIGSLTAGANYHLTVATIPTFSITPKTLNIFANSTTKTFGTTLTFNGTEFTTGSGELVNGTSVASVTLTSTGAAASAAAGTYPIVINGATGTGLGNYSILYHNGTLTVTGKPTLTVTANNASRPYGTANPVFTGTIVGALNGDTFTATYSTSAVPTSPVGTYNIVPSVTGANIGNYNVVLVNGTLTITGKPTLTVTASNASRVYGAANPAFTGTIVGALNGDSFTATYSTTATPASAVGTYNIVPSVTGANIGNYNVVLVNGTLTVGKATLTVTADNKFKIYRTANPPLTATITGFVNGDTRSSSVTGNPNLFTSANTFSNVGTYTITVTQGTLASSNYTFTYVNGTLTIARRATLTVTANNVSRTYGTNNPALTVSYSGFINGETFATSGITGAPGVTTTANSGSAAGTYTITVTQGTLASTRYNFNYVNGTLTVDKASLTITANDGTKTYGTVKNFAGTEFSATGLVNGNTVNSVTLSSTGSIASANAGTYPIVATAAAGTGLSNYTIGYVNGILTVNPAALTITPNGGQSKVYGSLDPVFTFTHTPLVGSGDVTGLMGRTPGENVGNYAFNLGTLTAGSNYTLTMAANTFSITPLRVTVNARPQSKRQGTSDPTLTYTSNPGVGSSLANGQVISFSGTLNRVKGESVGTYPILIGSLRNSNYTISYVGANLTIYRRFGIVGTGEVSDTSAVKATDNTLLNGEFGLNVYPNPFTEHIYFELQMQYDAKVILEIYNINGVKLDRVFSEDIKGLTNYKIEYTPKVVSSQILVYRLFIDGKLCLTGKVIHK